MTGAQTSYLKTLSEQHGRPEAFAEGLTKAKASKQIDVLKDDGEVRGASGGSQRPVQDLT